jgi:hypothetical protein
MFGSTTATAVTFISNTQLTAIAPADSPGSVNVTVSTPKGTSATGNKNLYAYGPPTIASFTPASGITGSKVTITGTAFAPGLLAHFGPSVTGCGLACGTQLTATVPNGDPGPSTITLSDPQRSVTSTTQFTPTFSVSGFTPPSGPAATIVTINGIGFNRSSIAMFNGKAAQTSFISPTRLKATVPATATSAPITVTNTTAPAGTVSSASKFGVP